MNFRPSFSPVRGRPGSGTKRQMISCPACIPTSGPWAQSTKPLRNKKAKSKGRTATTMGGPERAPLYPRRLLPISGCILSQTYDRSIQYFLLVQTGRQGRCRVKSRHPPHWSLPGRAPQPPGIPGRGYHAPLHAVRLPARSRGEVSVNAGQSAEALVANAIREPGSRAEAPARIRAGFCRSEVL